MTTKLTVRNVYKIFGSDSAGALARLEQGQTKEQIFAETGQTVGVQDANFSVDEGEIFVIMGLSGSGKSTLVRMLNGLIKPSGGEILIDSDDVASADPAKLREIRRAKIAMVFQHFALFPHKTVVENVAYGLKVRGVAKAERRARALHALDQVGLKAHADTYTEELSGGMQQRVGLARGLATEPDILLMDEPFSALDPLIRHDMQGELLQLQRSLKKTIIFITHDLDEALVLGDRIAIMKGGKIVQIGTAREIVDHPADDYVTAFTENIDRAQVLTAQTAAVPAEPLEKSDTVATALRRMEKLDRNALYVVDDGKPLGVALYRDLHSGGHGPDATLSECRIVSKFPTTPPDCLLKQLYGKAGSGLPIAVIDGEGKLINVVEAAALLKELSGRSSEKASPEDVTTPVAASAA
ncbi:MAG TPA: glycine betaine/L-proline ABC transporter ATP-binding protein [Pararhizobium sp.]|nr:glycine betaine/L-proline ABC transporter ATP-binding protein [Pararhizobium sp.]